MHLRLNLAGDVMNTVLFSKLLDSMLAGIDLRRLAAIKARYGQATSEHDVRKYLNQTEWICHNLKIAMSLGLHHKRGLRILDLGSGAGYFPFVAARLGHLVKSVDEPDNGIYDALTRLYDVHRVEHVIEARTPLPDMGRFDLVTGLEMRFDMRDGRSAWNRADWETFLSNLSHHQLAPEGSIHLTLTERNGDSALPADVRDLFESIGVNVDAVSMTMTEQILATLAA